MRELLVDELGLAQRQFCVQEIDILSKEFLFMGGGGEGVERETVVRRFREAERAARSEENRLRVRVRGLEREVDMVGRGEETESVGVRDGIEEWERGELWDLEVREGGDGVVFGKVVVGEMGEVVEVEEGGKDGMKEGEGFDVLKIVEGLEERMRRIREVMDEVLEAEERLERRKREVRG